MIVIHSQSQADMLRFGLSGRNIEIMKTTDIFQKCFINNCNASQNQKKSLSYTEQFNQLMAMVKQSNELNACRPGKTEAYTSSVIVIKTRICDASMILNEILQSHCAVFMSTSVHVYEEMK